MSNTVLLRPPREQWLTLLGEMVQITNEAVRRRASTARDASKPLALEYMADRIDIDDPLFGYVAVTKDKGWMQGFVTCTTFTTWHRGFQWDSLKTFLDLAKPPHAADDDDGTQSSGSTAVVESGGRNRQQPSARAVDSDGRLSTELMTEVYAGDPDNEGVLWPRVAELSLLGALGCGKWLVQLIIDGLEARDSPYRFVVLMATDNAIPFYEHMGFVRVGAVQATRRVPSDDDDDDESRKKKRKKAHGGGGRPSAVADAGEVFSPHVEHVCDEDETCASVAARHGVETFDLLFLNQRHFPRLHQHAPLKRGTRLQVPKAVSVAEARELAAASRQEWHVVTEEATLKRVAERIGLEPQELLRLNKGRQGIASVHDLLRQGTRLLRAGSAELDFHEYCHWSFPDDDTPAADEASYMMVRRLKPHAERRDITLPSKEAEHSVSVIERTKRLLVKERPAVVPTPARQASFERARLARQSAAESAAAGGEEAAGAAAPNLMDKVVRIEGETSYAFWYVLTYLPDLRWCHVAPLVRTGTFFPNGRPKWMLVSEDEGGEVDVGAGRCHVVEAKAMVGSEENAELEEWDVREDEVLVVE